MHARKDELDSQYASTCGTVNSLTSQLNNNRTALSNLPTEGMTGEETLAYLELSKNLNIATINWNESLTQIRKRKSGNNRNFGISYGFRKTGSVGTDSFRETS